MDNSVIIKGTKSGIILVLDASLDFAELKERIRVKLQASAAFLGDAAMALSFEGRTLSDKEQREILDIIDDTTDLNIVCVTETDERKQAIMEKSLNDRLMELNTNTGQVLEVATSIIILGDVNPGAKVVSTGNIVVLGALKGNAYAGVSGNQNAFVLALDMAPVQVKIAEVIARCPDQPNIAAKNNIRNTQIAYLENGNLYIEPLSRDVINDIHLF
ncbi:MAG: septum site-determining protein MinC [Acetivibrio ethanolgignens]